ncbi:MAG: hypothetical protein VX278_16895, partial [Myxococcota bacterium]|nr:hypothetical protein [Myxococcota bacterium]
LFRSLEKQDPQKGFLRFRSKAYHERHLPPILRSEHRDVWAWKDTTGQRFRKLQTHIQDKEFLEKAHALYNEKIHPLSSIDTLLKFDTAPLIAGVEQLSKGNP